MPLHPLSPLQDNACLSFDLSQRPDGNVFSRMRNSHSTRFLRMRELVVAAARRLEPPTIRFDETDNCPAIHEISSFS
jgi:hypothetical protein